MCQNYTKHLFSLQVLHGMEKHFREELAKKFDKHRCKYNICQNFCVQKLSRYLHQSIMIHLCIHVLSKFHCQNISNNKNSVFSSSNIYDTSPLYQIFIQISSPSRCFLHFYETMINL